MEAIIESLSDWIKDIIRNAVSDFLAEEREKEDTRLLNVTETCELLGIKTDLFNTEYRYRPDFPRELPGKRWSRYAIKEWLKKQN